MWYLQSMAAEAYLQTLTRRRAVSVGAAAGIGAVAASGATRPEQCLASISTKTNVQPMFIALPDFLAGSPSDEGSARGISQIITADLKSSGLFASLDQIPFNERTNFDQQPPFAVWRALNAQALVIGRVTGQPEDRLRAEFRLWDVFGAVQLDGQQYVSMPDIFSHHFGPDLRPAHRREGLFRQSDRSYTRPFRKTGSSSASP
jgi:TolB protein